MSNQIQVLLCKKCGLKERNITFDQLKRIDLKGRVDEDTTCENCREEEYTLKEELCVENIE